MRGLYLFSGHSNGKPYTYAMHYKEDPISTAFINLSQNALVNYYLKDMGYIGFYLAETHYTHGAAIELVFKTAQNQLAPSNIKVPLAMAKNRDMVQEALLQELFYQLLDEDDKDKLSFRFYEMNQYNLLIKNQQN